MNKCKGCEWHNKPYWSIINPCDSCPNENDNMTIVQIDGVPVFKEALTEEEIKKAMEGKSIFELTIEAKNKEIERLNAKVKLLDDNRIYLNDKIDKAINNMQDYINKQYIDTSDIDISIVNFWINLLQGSDKDDK